MTRFDASLLEGVPADHEKLPPIQRSIVGLLSTHDELSVEQMAKTLRIKSHVVRYHLQKLLSARSIRRLVRIDTELLGLQSHNFFFNLNRKHAAKVLSFLRDHPIVSWLAENSWDRRYEMTAIVRSQRDVLELFAEIGERFSTHFLDTTMAAEYGTWAWGFKTLLPHPIDVPPLIANCGGKRVDVDEKDVKIMTFLTQRVDESIHECHRALGLSASTVAYRIERLRKLGVLSRERFYLLNSRRDFVEGQIVVEMKHLSEVARNHVVSVCHLHPHVEALLRCVGDWDYKILIYADTFDQLLEVEEGIANQLAPYARKTSLVLRKKRLMTLKFPNPLRVDS